MHQNMIHSQCIYTENWSLFTTKTARYVVESSSSSYTSSAIDALIGRLLCRRQLFSSRKVRFLDPWGSLASAVASQATVKWTRRSMAKIHAVRRRIVGLTTIFKQYNPTIQASIGKCHKCPTHTRNTTVTILPCCACIRLWGLFKYCGFFVSRPQTLCYMKIWHHRNFNDYIMHILSL